MANNFYKSSEIPTKNKINIISDYPDSKYDYIIEDDKIYASLKGQDNWTDVSNIEDLRKSLFQYIKTKYNFEGYEDREREIYNSLFPNDTVEIPDNSKLPGYLIVPEQKVNKQQLIGNKQSTEKVVPRSTMTETIDYVNQHKPSINIRKKQSENNLGYLEEFLDYQQDSNQFTNDKVEQKLKIDNPKSDFEFLWNQLVSGQYSSVINTIRNGLTRKFQMHVGEEEVPVVIEEKKRRPVSEIIAQYQRNLEKIKQMRQSKIPPSDAGQLVKTGRYYYRNGLNLNAYDYTYGARNRGQHKEIQSIGAPITTFRPFKTKQQTLNGGLIFNNYIGLDDDGKIKLGTLDDFEDNQMVSPMQYVYNITNFVHNPDGTYKVRQDPGLGNRKYNNPRVLLTNGKEINYNVLLDKKNPNLYGSVSGGKYLIKVGDELRIVAGSLSFVEKVFEDMKKRNQRKYGTFYVLDNGSFNRGLYPNKDNPNKLTRDLLINYDYLNDEPASGSFLYITNPSFKTGGKFKYYIK